MMEDSTLSQDAGPTSAVPSSAPPSLPSNPPTRPCRPKPPPPLTKPSQRASRTALSPSLPPSLTPSLPPSLAPSLTPSLSPSLTPSLSPSLTPSLPPSLAPSLTPSLSPSLTPSLSPSLTPSLSPSLTPSLSPSLTPSLSPSLTPSLSPSLTPSLPPSLAPSLTPSLPPSLTPSLTPSLAPSLPPSLPTSLTPSLPPSLTTPLTPSLTPSLLPSLSPSLTPSPSPSLTTSLPPSLAPSLTTSLPPSLAPSLTTSLPPSLPPSLTSSLAPSVTPSLPSSLTPSLTPSHPPSLTPSLPSSLTPSLPPYVPPSLPPPLTPNPVTPPLSPMLSTTSSDVSPTLSSPSVLPPPSSPTISSSSSSSSSAKVVPLPVPSPPSLSLVDKLVGSTPVWKPKGLNQDQITSIMEKQSAGAFLVQSSEESTTVISVRLPDEHGALQTHTVAVKQHKTFVHLNGSSLLFDDIFKLISFYYVSRDILAVPLRLPKAITMATNKEELDVISAKGADFWTSDSNQKSKNNDTHLADLYLYVNAVTMEERPNRDQNHSPILKADICTHPNSTSTVHNGESIAQTQGSSKPPPHLQTKYKRPPPRPPSLSSGSGMGLLFSSTSPTQTLPPVAPETERTEKEEEKEVEKEEEITPTVISPPVSRPPAPPQTRSAPPLPPAPIRRNLSIRSSGREGDVEKAADPEEDGKEKEKKGKEKENESTGSQCPPPVRKPSRPVPPPRTKPVFPNTPLHNNPAGGGMTNQKAGKKVAPPSPARRPDVSLYSPLVDAALGTEPDSCSTSSTEEEGEANHEPEQNNRITESRSPKAEVKRTSTTVMLDRARSRLSTVLTGLISHERRLTQRIVELARDPSSYFGNLVKEHRTFTLETMSNHSTSTALLQEIRQMMTQLKSYLLQSSELHAMMEPQHQYTQDKLESLVEAALCKSVLKPLREPIYQNLEKVHGDDNSLKQLAEKQSVVLGSTTTSLGITTAIPEASAMEKISIKLNNLHQEYSPQKKIELLLKTCKIIYDCMSVSSPGRAHGADDFLPVMMYVLARCNLAALRLDVEYMMELMDPSLTLGEGSYYLTTTYGALEHIRTFDLKGSASRQLSREVQDSIHRWERRRTLNQERVAQGSVRDFLTVCCPEMGSDPKTLGVLPNTTIQQLTEQCAARFQQDSYMISLYMDGIEQSLAPTELALAVKNKCHPGSYCFVFHPEGQPTPPVAGARSCPSIPPPPAPPPAASILPLDTAQVEEEESLISL